MPKEAVDPEGFRSMLPQSNCFGEGLVSGGPSALSSSWGWGELPSHPLQSPAQLLSSAELSRAICELGLFTARVPIGMAYWHLGTRLQQSHFCPHLLGWQNDLGELLFCVCQMLFLEEMSLCIVHFGAHLSSRMQSVNTETYRATFRISGVSAGPVFYELCVQSWCLPAVLWKSPSAPFLQPSYVCFTKANSLLLPHSLSGSHSTQAQNLGRNTSPPSGASYSSFPG